MQFVNSNNLVDFKDIENFRNKFLKETNYLWDILLDKYDEEMKYRMASQKLDL